RKKKGAPNSSERPQGRKSCQPYLSSGGVLGTTLLAERMHQVHQIPAYLFFGAIAFTANHFPLPVGDDVEELAIGHLLDRGGIAPVVQLQIHRNGQFTLAVAIFPVAHRAVIAEEALGFSEAFGSGLHRILFPSVVRGSWWRGRIWCLGLVLGVFL